LSLRDFRAKVVLEASISPSEDPAKVADAMCKVIGETESAPMVGPAFAKLTVDGDRALAHLRDRLRDRHIRSAARRQLLLSQKRRSSTLMLNRQAAAAGVLAICGSPAESPLGPIFLVLESDRVDHAIDWLTSYEEG
jgi:predicted RNA binding protein with dsRBD fold (UPF0201 family)